MLAGKVDGVSPHEHVSIATLDAIKGLARIRPTVYLPTHDPESAARLANRSSPGAGSLKHSAKRNMRQRFTIEIEFDCPTEIRASVFGPDSMIWPGTFPLRLHPMYHHADTVSK